MQKLIAAGISAGVLGLVLLFSFFALLGHNESTDWVVLQSPGGNISVIDRGGYYYRGFGTTQTYPRALYTHYGERTNDSKASDGISVTFNDTGTATMGAYMRLDLPLSTEQRIQLHQDFRNPEGVRNAARAHLQNCMKAAAPVMSASENQSSRKTEFNQIVEEQLSKGLFKMRRTTIELDDLSEIVEAGTDENGNKLTKEKKAKVQATEVVVGADGKPIVIQPSPLIHYGIGINQFSITETVYDDQTLKQFAAKKESYLNAEKSKAVRQEEVQKRLQIEEQGRRQVAEIQAEENQKKERALIQAQQAADVAVINKESAVTAAKQRVEVAEQNRQEAEALKSIATIEALTAELKKKALISAAEAQQKAIELGGGISEEKRVLAEIAAKRDAMVAEALAKVNVPQTVISGGSGNGSGSEVLNLVLLKSLGVLPNTPAGK